MKPKKPNKIYAEVAEELNIPEAMVNDIVSFYWSQVRRTMESLEDPYIDVDNLGMLYVKPKSLEMESTSCLCLCLDLLTILSD